MRFFVMTALGALIPMIEPRLRTPAAGETVALEVRHYGKAPARLRLYDDGETFNHEKGDFSWTGLSLAKDSVGKGALLLRPTLQAKNGATAT